MSPRINPFAARRAAASARADQPGAVYLLPHQDHRSFKVGWSLRPLQRIQHLPEFEAGEVDLEAAQVAWFPRAERAREVERSLHRGLAPYSAKLARRRDGYTEWFTNEGLVLAQRMLTLVPVGSREPPTRVQALSEAPGVPNVPPLMPLPPEAGALDTWYRVEDLWTRLGTLLPLALHLDPGDRTRRSLLWLGPRRLVEPGILLLRNWAVNLDTYQWTDGGQRRSLVTLMEWDQDDLALHLMPATQLSRWVEGDIVADLLQDHLARRAIPPRKAAP